jgi:acyl carrier protein
MTKEEILERVSDIMVESFGLSRAEIRPTAHLIDDLDLDSIDAVDLAVNVDQQLGLTLSEGELKAIQTVQDVVDLIHGRLA